MKVIFIASLSHSGSTLLDLMLNAHRDVISVGELKQLGRFARLEEEKLGDAGRAIDLWKQAAEVDPQNAETFAEIARNSFHWIAERSPQAGGDWRREVDVRARRA